LDYEDFLRQRGFAQWPPDDPRRQALVNRRCTTADEVAEWIVEIHKNGLDGLDGRNGRDGSGPVPSMKSMESIFSGLSANAVLVLIGVACALLDRQVQALAKLFESEGGFTERLYRIRSESKRRG